MDSRINVKINERYGRLIVEDLTYGFSSKGNRFTAAKCKCDCGSTVITRRSTLMNGATKSCGCLSIELSKSRKPHVTHGKTYSKEFKTWSRIKARCYNKNFPGYDLYGGRGIIVCERWINDFSNFYEDMGDAPSIDHSIDRIDVNGNYEPSNCRWADKKTQSRNKRTNLIITYGGITSTLVEHCERLNLRYGTIQMRILKGISPEIALSTPVISRKRKKNDN